MLVLLANIAIGATVHGSVYSFDLEKRTDAVVSVDSEPLQTMVSKDGEYSFELDIGEYTITAKYSEYGEVKEEVSENVKIGKEGSYVLDLILFPSFEEEEELLNETEEDVFDGEDIDYTTVIVFIAALVLLGFIFYLVFKYRKALQEVEKEVKKTSEKFEVSDELEKRVLEFIRSQDGRVTQKDIRKKFPYSEAKISLIISELEDKDVVKRIKKGRGNVIVLK